MSLVGTSYQQLGNDCIYNSRNYMSLVGLLFLLIRLDIYNSRNYMSLVGRTSSQLSSVIYNSRNYMSLVGSARAELITHLSTIVEII